MNKLILPGIDYKKFAKTRNTIQLYAQLLSVLKGKFVTHQKNWEEFSLKVYAKGFTTTPIPIETENGIEALDLNLNFVEHKLKIFFKDNRDEIDLNQKNISAFTKALLIKLSDYGIKSFEVEEKFFGKDELVYDKNEVTKLWDLFRQVYFILLEFRGSTLFETSNINFWAHHFDIAMLVFSGGLIDGQDPQNWDYSHEQMNFGFSSGDDGVGEPYFYITAYPFDEKLFALELPKYARWQKEGWKGAVIELSKIAGDENFSDEFLSLIKKLLEENYK